ncbi:hypothetical protein NARC_100072 [Candidatus Nitrosocosmicus arcticus]|uniref:Uncharacterized protein n=1 Tax=Candidatus Nitrosocosmicus arcticus TaxID=2035267 RepID=A0A557STU4_9ARCH|nr:hypothetical protein NARC_100072 [Candidatus Nitrosocosmicus arcticus]
MGAMNFVYKNSLSNICDNLFNNRDLEIAFIEFDKRFKLSRR